VTSPLPMTAGRWAALVIGTPLALVAIGWTALTAVAWAGLGTARVSLAVPVQPSQAAAVTVDTGDVHVSPGVAGRIRVHGILRYSLVAPQVSWQRTPSAVTLRSHCRVPTGECSLDYAVTVPATGRSEISVGSGDVTAAGLAGPVTLTSESGDVTATRIAGSATISDKSGDIVVRSLSAGRAVITDASGTINATGVSSQDLTVRDHSGDITVVFTAVPASVTVSDSSGNVTLVLPHGPAAYHVIARTASGGTTIAVPRSAFSPHVITVTDQSGNITVTQ
jgi:Toastrack DUF4097